MESKKYFYELSKNSFPFLRKKEIRKSDQVIIIVMSLLSKVPFPFFAADQAHNSLPLLQG